MKNRRSMCVLQESLYTGGKVWIFIILPNTYNYFNRAVVKFSNLGVQV